MSHVEPREARVNRIVPNVAIQENAPYKDASSCISDSEQSPTRIPIQAVSLRVCP